EVDRGEQGIAAIKFLAGSPKGIRAIRFPAPKMPKVDQTGRPAFVTVVDNAKNVQKVSDLRPLYRLANGAEFLEPKLIFKKTLKLDLGNIQKLHVLAGKSADGREMLVTYKDGAEETLTLLRIAALRDSQATMVGLLGQVPAGYKLFPIHTIAEIHFDEKS